jgi:hypothetical protein
MTSDPTDFNRRALLQITAGFAAAGGAAMPAAHAAAPAKAVPPVPNGKPGDFNFLSGEWKIKNRQFKSGGIEEFDGEATVHGILAGVGSVEELRIPSRGFSGMGLRLLDIERRLWADHWVNAKSGVLTPPPSWGSFVDGVGLWDADDEDAGRAVIVRGCWDQITASSCRWYQASSHDGGKTWQKSWEMHWNRA